MSLAIAVCALWGIAVAGIGALLTNLTPASAEHAVERLADGETAIDMDRVFEDEAGLVGHAPNPDRREEPSPAF